MDDHLKSDHCARDAAYKCVDCDYNGENAGSEQVHHAKLHWKKLNAVYIIILGKTIEK